MIGALIIILIVLWFFGYVHLANFFIPDIILFHINGRPVTLWDVLILLVVSWAIGILPTPLKQIAAILLLFWILSTLGILAFAGLPSILVIAIIFGLVFALLEGGL
jgi:hypothetical protein